MFWNKLSNIKEEHRNLFLAGFTMCLCVMAMGTSGGIQNVALADSTNIDLSVGYYAEICLMTAGIVSGFIYVPIVRWTGLNLIFLIGVFLRTGSYWSMIWIVNEATIILGSAISGIGAGIIWISLPKIVIANSTRATSQRNMGFWWVSLYLGVMIGTLLNFFYFMNVTRISDENRIMVYSVCTGVTVLAGIVGFVGFSDITKNRARHTRLTNLEKEVVPDEGNVIEEEKEENEDDEMEGIDVESLEFAKVWFRKMARTPGFWWLLIPLVHWGFVWGFSMKIFPTSIASVSNNRGLLPLGYLVQSGAALIGSFIWVPAIRLTNSTSFCLIVAVSLDIIAVILSILILPSEAATTILEVGTAKTYIPFHEVYVLLIPALLGLCDGGFSILYYSIAGKIFGKGLDLGMSINNNGFCVFYIASMFAPSLFDLHSYCAAMICASVAMLLTLLFGLRKYF